MREQTAEIANLREIALYPLGLPERAVRGRLENLVAVARLADEDSPLPVGSGPWTSQGRRREAR